MNTTKFLLIVGSSLLAPLAVAAGDPVVGAQKATLCTACHGSNAFPGMFPLVQLGGRDADKLVIKTNKYRSGKLLSPMMNMAVMFINDKDVEDIAAYYHSLGKPAMSMLGIKGDDDIQAGN